MSNTTSQRQPPARADAVLSSLAMAYPGLHRVYLVVCLILGIFTWSARAQDDPLANFGDTIQVLGQVGLPSSAFHICLRKGCYMRVNNSNPAKHRWLEQTKISKMVLPSTCSLPPTEHLLSPTIPHPCQGTLSKDLPEKGSPASQRTVGSSR